MRAQLARCADQDSTLVSLPKMALRRGLITTSPRTEIQNGLRAISGGRFGNGWLAGAFLENSVQSFGDTIEAVADFNFRKASNVAGSEALGDTAGPLVTNAASRVPNVAITVGGAVAASVAIGSYSVSASIAGSETFNLSKAATGRCWLHCEAFSLAVLGTIKLPIDLAVAGFSAVACGVNF